jgi:hypothetical protein
VLDEMRSLVGIVRKVLQTGNCNCKECRIFEMNQSREERIEVKTKSENERRKDRIERNAMKCSAWQRHRQDVQGVKHNITINATGKRCLLFVKSSFHEFEVVVRHSCKTGKEQGCGCRLG